MMIWNAETNQYEWDFAAQERAQALMDAYGYTRMEAYCMVMRLCIGDGQHLTEENV